MLNYLKKFLHAEGDYNVVEPVSIDIPVA